MKKKVVEEKLSHAELEKKIQQIVAQHVFPIYSKITPHLTAPKDGKYYVNIMIHISDDKNDDLNRNKTQLAIMKYEKALINMFRLDLGIEVSGVGVS